MDEIVHKANGKLRTVRIDESVGLRNGKLQRSEITGELVKSRRGIEEQVEQWTMRRQEKNLRRRCISVPQRCRIMTLDPVLDYSGLYVHDIYFKSIQLLLNHFCMLIVAADEYIWKRGFTTWKGDHFAREFCR
jgi:hypothetical protein